ncbi:hypothetical protein ABPG74_013447 [Tetrahymena malaccensis]
MGIYLNSSQYKISTAILFIVSITFCSAMIGIVATYWLQRYNTCNDLNLGNCNQQTHDYLFDGYRNITNKFFVDCFNLIFNLISVGIVSIAFQKVPKTVQHILVLILLALSVWSLACTIKSIDEEDKLDQIVVQKQTSVQIQLLTGEAAIASANASVTMYQSLLPQLNQAIALLQGITQLKTAGVPNSDPRLAPLLLQAQQLQTQYPMFTTLASVQTAQAQVTGAISQFNTAISAGQAQFPIALSANDSLQKLHDKYQNYRKSCMALVLINFVSIFLIFMFNIFSFPTDSNRVEIAKLEQVVTTNGGLENVAFKKAPSSNIEMNAQNVM